MINRDGHLQRPDFDDANYTKWDRLSTRVGQWLSGQVDEELKQQLINEPSEPIHADEVYAAIIWMISEQDLTATTNAFYRVVDMKQEEYTTIRQFVDAFHQNLNIAKDNKFILSNYIITYLFIKKIQDELPVFVETSKAMKLIHEKMTNHDVLWLMNEAVNRSTIRTKSIAAIPKTSDNKNNKNPSCFKGFDPSKLQGAPPKDRKVKEWVAE